MHAYSEKDTQYVMSSCFQIAAAASVSLTCGFSAPHGEARRSLLRRVYPRAFLLILYAVLGANSSAVHAQEVIPAPYPGGVYPYYDPIYDPWDPRYDLDSNSDQPAALNPENLKRKRPKPGFDLTGSWQQKRAPYKGVPQSNHFWPYPKFKEAAQKALEEGLEAARRGLPYRDDSGRCYPIGMPKIMSRVWPIGMIQLPTAIFMVSAFMNSLRVVYMDGREHTGPDLLIDSYNGESIGRWEGKTLVIDTIGFESNKHWIDTGIPVSNQLHIIERVTMVEKDRLEWIFIMTDPVNWEGEWRSTMYFTRRNMDIPEVECTPILNERLGVTEPDAQ